MNETFGWPYVFYTIGKVQYHSNSGFSGKVVDFWGFIIPTPNKSGVSMKSPIWQFSEKFEIGNFQRSWNLVNLEYFKLGRFCMIGLCLVPFTWV